MKKVFIGLSGGVDSSVAALRLLNAGYEVVGVFIKTWHPDFIVCNEEADRLSAMRVAAYLKIPFLTCDAEEEYKRDVAEYMIEAYRRGETPNPDVMCNKYVKFGAFLDFAKKHGADYIATGHYARVETHNGEVALYRGKDREKDQSYFLSALTNDQLAQTLFPLGGSLKSEIREEAKTAGLPTADRPDSQGICFLGAVDIQDFLSHYIPSKKGVVVNEAGEEIGEHAGTVYYTIGERHGFSLEGVHEPHYITKKDNEKNILTVSPQKPTTDHLTLFLRDVQIFAHKEITSSPDIEIEARYHQKPVKAVFSMAESKVTASTSEKMDIPSSGQSCVFYRGERILGSGIIDRVETKNIC